MVEHFSVREGHLPAPRITVREDAPNGLRAIIPVIAENAGLGPGTIYHIVCSVLQKAPDGGYLSYDENARAKIGPLLAEAPWYKVYDIAEALYNPYSATVRVNEFKQNLNNFFVENGIGWELHDGLIIRRGSEAFQRVAHEVPDLLNDCGFQRASGEIREASNDISRRPNPDITGAIQHAMAALEATARGVTGQPNQTLGQLVPLLNLPPPLDRAVSRLWGYASERARHIREQQAVENAEAELIVAVAGSLCAFVVQRER